MRGRIASAWAWQVSTRSGPTVASLSRSHPSPNPQVRFPRVVLREASGNPLAGRLLHLAEAVLFQALDDVLQLCAAFLVGHRVSEPIEHHFREDMLSAVEERTLRIDVEVEARLLDFLTVTDPEDDSGVLFVGTLVG